MKANPMQIMFVSKLKVPNDVMFLELQHTKVSH